MKVKPEKIFVTYLKVQGSGEFPIDMLRYDRCVPRTEVDSHFISKRTDPPRIVCLIRYSVNVIGATKDRWKSFGWEVLAEEPRV
jgi:hypothetical protein